ncbi:uncharacterized protein UV8b_00255 [Ustilaginoidea virens]|uniref:Uncharacterized protein n=1 Tax=Ustilaginoidea virens TaxID=1159556 RepID=A0A8E5HIH6_USTVR|nr:uncharacterized protein UV8b_00255 [Ustilaginoidea virens]QUC16014.1 hypothetical protein UV8b_00255 [Ustilaginoidea virens]
MYLPYGRAGSSVLHTPHAAEPSQLHRHGSTIPIQPNFLPNRRAPASPVQQQHLLTSAVQP